MTEETVARVKRIAKSMELEARLAMSFGPALEARIPPVVTVEEVPGQVAPGVVAVFFDVTVKAREGEAMAQRIAGWPGSPFVRFLTGNFALAPINYERSDGALRLIMEKRFLEVLERLPAVDLFEVNVIEGIGQ